MLAWVSSEKTVFNPIPDFLQRSRYTLREALLITKFVKQGVARNIQFLTTSYVDFKYFT